MSANAGAALSASRPHAGAVVLPRCIPWYCIVPMRILFRTSAFAACVLALAAPGPAAAGEGDPRVERAEAGGIRFTVVLPGGYERSASRYPVLYLLHPFGEAHDSWLTETDLLDFTAERRAIVVLPDAETTGVVVDGRDGSCRRETQLMAGVIPYVDARYRTVAGRAGRAIAGASSGGFSALHVAARNPDRFAAAASLSGPADVTLGLNPAGQAAFLPVERAAVAECGGNPADLGDGLFGSPLRDELWVHDANPPDLAANFRGMSVFVSAGNGQPCDGEDLPDVARGAASLVLTQRGSASFSHALDRAGVPHTADTDRCGVHSWRYFQRDLHRFWPQMTEAFASRRPRSFDHRRAAPRFSAWGWSFAADPKRAPELLDVRSASRRGLTLTGSGTTSVTTARYFRPGQRVRVATVDAVRVVRAGHDGRLAFTVDLGTPHEVQQYRQENALAEQDPDHFTTRTVRLSVRRPAPAGTRFRPAAQYEATAAGAGSGAGSIGSADFDGDGRPDLAIADPFGAGVSVLLNRGDGTFRPPLRSATLLDAYAVEAADLDADERPDLVAASDSGGFITILHGKGDGTFAVGDRYVTGPVPQEIVAEDLDRDGRRDLAVLTGSEVVVLHGHGDGRFVTGSRAPTGGGPTSIAAADLDLDGDRDLAVANGSPRLAGADTLAGSVTVLLGNGDGTFARPAEYAAGRVPESVAAGDLDGDGAPDLVTANAASGDVSVLLGRGDGRLRPALAFPAHGVGPAGVVIADLDRDRRNDLAVGNSQSARVSVLAGTGGGRFAHAGSYEVGSGPQPLVARDLNGDGLLDLAVPLTFSPKAAVLINASRPPVRPRTAER